jgi:heptosyltransferase III
MATPEKILIVRTDRLGDVLLTTPVNSAIKERYPKAKIVWLVRPYAAPLLENNPDVDGVILDRDQPMDTLIKEVREQQFDAAVIVYPRWRTAWATWRAGIPVRIGPTSKWYSLFFSQRIWQHRSEGKKHEADFNLELLEPLGIPFKRYSTTLRLTEEERQKAHQVLEGHRISFQKPVIALHPGSGGSSQRWPLSQFIELGDRLQEAGCDVLVTGGPGENYQNIMIDQMRRIPVFIAAGSVSVRELAAIYACTTLMVSNSTGPLHLAVAVGVPTVSVYSPVATCHPRRWGPYPAWVEGDKKHGVAVAPDNGLEQADMRAVTVDEVLALCQIPLGKSLVSSPKS